MPFSSESFHPSHQDISLKVDDKDPDLELGNSPSPSKEFAPSRSRRGFQLLQTVQSTSGLVFATFVSLHVINHLLIPVGSGTSLDTANRFMLLGRVYYQSWAEHVITTGAIIIHVSSGIAVAAKRRKKARARAVVVDNGSMSESSENVPDDGKQASKSRFSWQRMTGYILIGIVPLHMYATRILPMIHLGDSSLVDYSLIATSLQASPYIQLPAYTVLAIAGIYHTVTGIDKSFRRFGLASSSTRPAKGASDLSPIARKAPTRQKRVVNTIAITLFSGTLAAIVMLYRYEGYNYMEAEYLSLLQKTIPLARFFVKK